MVVVAVGDVGLLEKGAEGRLELPVGRLQQLLRLVGSAARGQNKLVDHDLVPQLIHVHRHGSDRRVIGLGGRGRPAALGSRSPPPAASGRSPPRRPRD